MYILPLSIPFPWESRLREITGFLWVVICLCFATNNKYRAVYQAHNQIFPEGDSKFGGDVVVPPAAI